MPGTKKPRKPLSTLTIGWAPSGKIITIKDPSPEMLKALEVMKR
jgi:hypothetical protein